jgi:ribosomal protein S27AE
MFLRVEEGYSHARIAEELGVARQTVTDWLQGVGEVSFLRECARCGATFFAHGARHIHCGKRCPGEWPKPAECKLCRKPYLQKSKVHLFCTERCYGKYRRVFGGRARTSVA